MKRKNDLFSQAIVGFFMVTVLLLLGYFTIVVSGVDVLAGRNRRPLDIVFDQVGGLKDHDNVMYRGTKVGTVEHVEVMKTNLVVHTLVDAGVVLRANARARVCNTSMLGGTFLLLEEGEGEIKELGSVPLKGVTPTDWMEEVAEISRHLRALTTKLDADYGPLVEDVKATMADAKAAATNIKEISEKINAEKDSIVGDLKTTVADAKITAANAKEISAKFNAEKAEVVENLKAGIASFRKAAEGLDVKETVAKADKLLENLNAAAENLKEGRGTLGRLNNDPKLYDEINGLIRDVRQVLDNYRDTTPISTFSSLATGAL